MHVFLLASSIRHRVIPAAAPGVAAEDAAEREGEAFERAVLGDGLDRVFTAGGREAAAGTEQRGNNVAVEFDRQQDEPEDDALGKGFRVRFSHQAGWAAAPPSPSPSPSRAGASAAPALAGSALRISAIAFSTPSKGSRMEAWRERWSRAGMRTS